MKKFTGNYTTEAGKVLKGSERLICAVAAEDEIYISNGYVLYKMNRFEYAATIQPVTCCEPGNWRMNKTGERTEENGMDLAKLFADTLKTAGNSDALTRCPLAVQIDNKTTAATYYAAEADFTALFNTKFISALTPSAALRSAGPVSAAIAYAADEPFAIVLPIKPKAEAARAVKAYFTEADDKAAEADKLRVQVEQLRAELRQAQHEIECQSAELAEAARRAEHKTEQPEPVEPRTAAELIAARFNEFDGVTATIKGAHTAAPVVWLSGETEKHTDKLEAAGAKWSNKKSAWYVRVA